MQMDLNFKNRFGWSCLAVAVIMVATPGCANKWAMPISNPNPTMMPQSSNPLMRSNRETPGRTNPTNTDSIPAQLPEHSFPQQPSQNFFQENHPALGGQPARPAIQPSSQRPPADQNMPSSNVVFRAQDGGQSNQGQQNNSYPYPTGQGNPTTAFQQPQNVPGSGFQQPGTFADARSNQNSPQVGAPNGINPVVGPNSQSGVLQGFPQNYADLDIYAQEGQTGRIMIGGAFNSDNGLTGNIIIDEKNFDIMRFPRSFREIIDGEAWRGNGQNFRMELVPGNDVQRYLVSFTEPYLFNTRVSFSASGYYYVRQYFDWDEKRLGGRLSLGYRLNHDLSVSVGTRLENVDIYNPRLNTSPQLNADLGNNEMYTGFLSLIHDTRDHPFMATEGAYLELRGQQAFGDYDYSRVDFDYRRYFLFYQRPDSSGRHTLNVGTKIGYSGEQTPVFENYFAGGFSTLRGFDFRGASPIEGGIRVGGEFQWLNTVEYMFPLTADDMIKAVVFCDFGTVEQNVALNSENFRVAPGFGFRIHMPAAGMGGAPLAFDFAFPVSEAAGDDKQVFTFYLGVLR